jgi:hypothetical protein
LSATNNPEVGATFTLKIPITKSTNAPTEAFAEGVNSN